jgi:hypothetical protein
LQFYKGISVDRYLYVGGSPFFDQLLTKTIVIQHFIGCIRQLIVNGERLLDDSINLAHNIDKLG